MDIYLYNFLFCRQAISDVIELCEQSLISPHVSESFNLENVNDAVKLLIEDQIVGKIIITIPNWLTVDSSSTFLQQDWVKSVSTHIR